MPRDLIKIDLSDAKISQDRSKTLVTYALGSCMGVCIYDPAVPLAGMLHCLLADSTENPEEARKNPFKYADTGMETLLEKMISMGAQKRRMKVNIAGGAKSLKTISQGFDIGKRNYLAIRKILWKKGMFIDSEDVGGSLPRTMYMDIADGTVSIKSYSRKRALSQANDQ